MSNDTERLVVSLEARVRDFERNFQKAGKTAAGSFDQIEKRAKQSTQRLDESMGGVFSKIGGYGKSLAAGLVAGGAVGVITGIKQAVNDSTKSILEMADQAKRAGVSFKGFQALKFAADQNRVSVDALTDGLKELNIRGDEFIKTGKGSGEESFKRLGYSATELAEKMKAPEELFVEIIGRIGQLDKAAQIRVQDELFGGTAAEQFGTMVARGEKGIRKQIKAAQDLGIVMDDSMIKKAEEVQQKFDLIATTIGTNIKAAIVDAVSAWTDFLDSFRAFENQKTNSLETKQAELSQKRLDLENDKLKIQNGDGSAWLGRKDGPLAQGQIVNIERQILELDKQIDQITNEINQRVKTTAANNDAPAVLDPITVTGGKSGTNPYATAKKFDGATQQRDSGILKSFFKEANQNIDPKIIPWCAAFVNAALAANGMKGTGSNAARSFLNYGEETKTPQKGDIVVLKRGTNPSEGHVGFYEGEDEDGNIRVFGGNQSKGVNTKSFKKENVLGYRTIPGADRATSEDTLGDELTRRLESAETAQEKIKAYQDLLNESRAFIAEQGVERQALDMTAVAAAKLRYEQQLLADAQRAGVEVTPQQRAEIAQLAQGMAEAEQATKSYALTQDQAKEMSTFFAQSAADGITGLINGTMTAQEAIQNLIGTLAQAAIQAALLGTGPLAGLLGGGAGGAGGGGILGTIFNSLTGVKAKNGGEIQAFASGGKVKGPGGPRDDKVLAWLSNGEHVVNAKAAGQNRAALEAMNKGQRLPSASAAAMIGGPVIKSTNNVNNTFAPTIPITVTASGNQETDKLMTDRMTTEISTMLDNKLVEFTMEQQRSGNMMNRKGFI